MSRGTRERREQSLEGKKFYVIKSRDAGCQASKRKSSLSFTTPGKRILKGSTRPFLLLKSSLDDVNAAASLSNTITESTVWILTIILHSVTSVANECKKRYSSISLENFRFVWSFEGCCCLLFKSACQRLFSQLENVRCSSSIFLLHFPLHSTELQMPPLQMH